MKSFNTFVNEILEAAELDEASHRHEKNNKFDFNAKNKKKDGRPKVRDDEAPKPVHGKNYAEEVEVVDEAANAEGLPDSVKKMMADKAAADKAKNLAKHKKLQKTGDYERKYGKTNAEVDEEVEVETEEVLEEGSEDHVDASTAKLIAQKKAMDKEKNMAKHRKLASTAAKMRAAGINPEDELVKKEETELPQWAVNANLDEEAAALEETTSVDRLPPSARAMVDTAKKVKKTENMIHHRSIRRDAEIEKAAEKMVRREEVSELEEDAPANNVGGGNVAGVGPGQVPPVKLKKKTPNC